MNKINEVVKEIQRHGQNNLYGILLVGSRGRKDFDIFSDYDLICIYKNTTNLLFSEGTSLIEGNIYGFRNVPYDYLANKNFNQIEKHAYVNSKILFDKNGKIKSLIRDKCIWNKNERLNLFCDYLVKLSYSYNIMSNYKNCWNYCKELEKALNRNNRIHTFLEIFDLMKYSIYLELLNKNIFIPPDKILFSKWTINKSYRIKRIQELFLKYNEKNPIKFAEELRPIVSKIVKEFEIETTLPSNIYKYRLGVTRRYE